MRPLQYWLKPQVLPHAWCHGRLRVKVDQACIAALAPWKAPLRDGKMPLGMGTSQFAFIEGHTCAGHIKPRSRHAISEQRPLRGVDAPSANGSENLGKSLARQRSKSLPQKTTLIAQLIFRRTGRLSAFFCLPVRVSGPPLGVGRPARLRGGGRLAQPPASCFPPNHSDPLA